MGILIGLLDLEDESITILCNVETVSLMTQPVSHPGRLEFSQS
jgi:hypothetical protein